MEDLMTQLIVVKNRWEAQGLKFKYGLTWRKKGNLYLFKIKVPETK
jgi:hypothetical protein